MELFIVWYSRDNGWKPSRSMTQEQANIYAKNLELDGYNVIISKRPQNTIDDILES